jgi:hypothetical protein
LCNRAYLGPKRIGVTNLHCLLIDSALCNDDRGRALETTQQLISKHTRIDECKKFERPVAFVVGCQLFLEGGIFVLQFGLAI